MSTSSYAQIALSGQNADAATPMPALNRQKPISNQRKRDEIANSNTGSDQFTDTIRAFLAAKTNLDATQSPDLSNEGASDNFEAEFIANCLGGLGNIVVDVMAPSSAATLAVIGTGQAAAIQIEAAIAARSFKQIRIYGRQPVAAAALAKRFRNSITAEIAVVATPEEAVHNADVIILASDQSEAVIATEWVSPTAHISAFVNTGAGRQPLPNGMINRARTVASDNPGALEGIIRSVDLKLDRTVPICDLIDTFNPNANRALTLFIAADPIGLARATQGAAQPLVHSQ